MKNLNITYNWSAYQKKKAGQQELENIIINKIDQKSSNVSKWNKMYQNRLNGTKQIKMDQNGSKWIKCIKMEQNGSKQIKWKKIDQNGSKWIKWIKMDPFSCTGVREILDLKSIKGR